jgi:CHAT domain-containing protein
MKILFLLVALLLVTTPVFAELTSEDIRIIREEVTAIVKAENAELEKRMQKYVDLKFETLDTKFTEKFVSVEKRQTIILIFVTGLIALIVLAIGIPQIIVALRQKDYNALEAQVKNLQEKVELLEEIRLVKPN